MREHIWGCLLESFACWDLEWRYVGIYFGEEGIVSIDMLWPAGLIVFLLFFAAVRRRY